MDKKSALTVTASSDRQIVMAREFNAPRKLVFQAHITPELLKRWLLGPPGWEMTKCEAVAKAGDKYRYEWRHANGQTMSIHGVCIELVAPEKIVTRESMQGLSDDALVTAVFVERGGKTQLTTTIECATREIRDVMLKSGMEQGVAMSYERLEKLIAPPSEGATMHAEAKS